MPLPRPRLWNDLWCTNGDVKPYSLTTPPCFGSDRRDVLNVQRSIHVLRLIKCSKFKRSKHFSDLSKFVMHRGSAFLPSWVVMHTLSPLRIIASDASLLLRALACLNPTIYKVSWLHCFICHFLMRQPVWTGSTVCSLQKWGYLLSYPRYCNKIHKQTETYRSKVWGPVGDGDMTACFIVIKHATITDVFYMLTTSTVLLITARDSNREQNCGEKNGKGIANAAKKQFTKH